MHRTLLAAAAVAMSACTQNNFYGCQTGSTGTGAGSAITLTSEVRFGATQRLQDNQILSGERIGLFVTRTGSTAYTNQLYANTRITADGAGGFTYSVPMYYPSDGGGVDFFAVHPWTQDTSLSAPMQFAVQADQTLQANYLASDLLYGNKTNVTPQTGAIPLTFYHRLSKLDFVITTRSTAIDLNKLTEVTVTGILPRTTVDIRTGRRTAATGEPITVKAYGNAVVTGQAGAQTATGFTAIVVPQTVAGGKQLFGLVVDGRAMQYTLADDFGFASGNRYTVMLDVSDTGVTLTSQIADWVDGGTIGGSAGPN